VRSSELLRECRQQLPEHSVVQTEQLLQLAA
jgi:hypothetical protein